VARSRFVHAGDHGVHDSELRRRTDALCRYARALAHEAARGRGVLERTHDGGADGDDAPAVRFRSAHRDRGRARDEIRLVEG